MKKLSLYIFLGLLICNIADSKIIYTNCYPRGFFCVDKRKGRNKKINNLILVTIVALHMVAILLSGNKMPMILFLFGCVLIFFLIKDLRFVLSLGLLFFLSAFFLLVNYDNYENTNYYKASYKTFINDVNIIKFIKAENSLGILPKLYEAE